jgi:hypothetical protein
VNTSTVIATAVVIASIALHIDLLLYWIGPAGCIILIPALIIVLTLPLLDENSWLTWAKPRINEALITDIPEVLTATRMSSQAGTHSALSVNYQHVPGHVGDGIPSPQLGLNDRQLSGIRQLGQWIKTFIGPGSLNPARTQNFDVLDKAEKIKITERIKPDGVRERSVMIFYRKI